METYREQKKDLHIVFTNLEKAHDSISRNIIWLVSQLKVLRGHLFRPYETYMRSGITSRINT